MLIRLYPAILNAAVYIKTTTLFTISVRQEAVKLPQS